MPSKRCSMSETLAATVPASRCWHRFTLAEQMVRYAVWLAIALAVVQSLRTMEVIPEFLSDAPAQMGDMAERMWPVDWAYLASGVWPALVETIHIATLGTLLSLLLAIPFGLLVA